MNNIEDPERDQPSIWKLLKESIQTWSEGSDIILWSSRNWEELDNADDDKFRHSLAETNAYAAFLVRALVGSPESSNPFDSNCIKQDGTALRVPAPIASYLVKQARIDNSTLIGADLVARVALITARRISKASNCRLAPLLDCCKPNGQVDRGHLRFLSADFVVAKTRHPHRRQVENATYGCCPNIYYHYGWLEGRPPKDTWHSHGWRARSDREFTNNPNVEKKENEIETFLGFPAFFKHDEANVIFSIPHHSDCPGQIICCSSYEILRDQGIAPYVRMKREEYSKRAESNSSIKGCVVLCIGVSGQRTAYFDPSDLTSSYGVFLTMDLECGGSGCGTARCCDKQFWDNIVNDLRDARYQIKYKALQVLTGRLLDEREAQHRELQKYKQMFDLLTIPLRSLTEALAQTQADTQELRAIIYEPLDAIFVCQPQVAELFDETKPIPELGWKPEHQPENYQDLDKASSVLALALARFRGLSQVNGACNLETQVLFYSDHEKKPSQPYYELSKKLRNVLGLDCWESLSREVKLKDIQGYLIGLKERFFTSYKPRETQNSPLRWTVLKSFIGNDTVISSVCTCNAATYSEQDKFIAVARGSNPLCTHGHLIEFICGVVGREKVRAIIAMTCPTVAQPGGMQLDTDNASVVKFALALSASGDTMTPGLERAWIQTSQGADELRALINNELENRGRNAISIGQHGNFHAPFVRLVRRIPDELIKVVSVEGSGCDVTITLGARMKIAFEGTQFIVESKK